MRRVDREGVRTGKIRSANRSSIRSFSSEVSWSQRRISMPCAASSGRISSWNTRACSATSSRSAEDRRVHLARHHPAHGGHGDTGRDPALRPGHPDHVELVEVGGEDGQELRPLQQRHRSLSLARSSTRLLKASQDSSRSRNRSAGSGSAAGRVASRLVGPGSRGLQASTEVRCRLPPSALLRCSDGTLRVHHITPGGVEAIARVQRDGEAEDALDVELHRGVPRWRRSPAR